MTAGSGVSRTPLRWPLGVTLAVALVALGALTAWSLLTVLQPAESPDEEPAYTLATVEPGTVESSVTLDAVATWPKSPVALNQAVGIVTTVTATDGSLVQPGTVLYSVNLRPVVVARGSVPAFRDISAETEGPDLRQLQSLLNELDFYSGTADGKGGPRTETAIKAWQEALGVYPSGNVQLGDLVFVPDLPARVVVESAVVSVGKPLQGGEGALSRIADAPEITIPTTVGQSEVVAVGTPVEVASPVDGTWSGSITEIVRPADSDTIKAILRGPADTPICGNSCASLPVFAETTIPAKVITVPSTSGLLVPVAALASGSDGTVFVQSEQGDSVRVEVTQSARGLAVVTGVTAGERVRIPAQEPK